MKFGATSSSSSRPLGKFSWQSNGMVPFQAEVSRAMWRLSAGSGGSAGKKGEAVLTADEFWALVKLSSSGYEIRKDYMDGCSRLTLYLCSPVPYAREQYGHADDLTRGAGCRPFRRENLLIRTLSVLGQLRGSCDVPVPDAV